MTIAADELALLAPNAGEEIQWIRNQGRSFGVRPLFATQFPDQLERNVLETAIGFPTVLAYKTNSTATAARLAREFNTTATPVSEETLLFMQKYHFFLRTNVGGNRQETVAVKADFFEHDMGAFGPAQGFAPASPAPLPSPTPAAPTAEAPRAWVGPNGMSYAEVAAHPMLRHLLPDAGNAEDAA